MCTPRRAPESESESRWGSNVCSKSPRNEIGIIMTRNGYNAVAVLAIVGAVVLAALEVADREVQMALVVLAGTVVGRGDKSA